jgi:hypothetical protein
VLSADPQHSSREQAFLQPHVWQHLQYLNHRQLAPGQILQVCCSLASPAYSAAASEAMQALSLTGSGRDLTGTAAPPGPDPPLALQLDVLLVGSQAEMEAAEGDSLLLSVPAEQSAIAAAVPLYHTTMLNDSERTVAYREGIAAAMQQAAEQAALRGSSQAPLVLEIGSGSGLLCLLACSAGARHVVGCERLPELQAAAEQLLAANGMADRVTILPKHSKELTVAADPEVATTAGAAAAAAAAAAAVEGATTAVQEANAAPAPAANLPRRADVLIHEIFGTDPFSEGAAQPACASTQCMSLDLLMAR